MSRIRVLVVDDSAFARKVVREVLSRDPQIDVIGMARDGLEALEKIASLQPDVVTLDLTMPELDGLGVLRGLPQDHRPRIVVVSVSRADSDLAIEALQSGAVDLVMKPTALATDRLYGIAEDLAAKVKSAAEARPLPPLDLGAPAAAARSSFESARRAAASAQPAARLVVIGTSTGGPQALTRLFAALPGDLPVPMAVALHIPPGYTEPLAARLSRLGGPPIVEARDGQVIYPGEAVIAPGGKHLRVRRSADRFIAEVSREPVDSLHHPSVDVLFESAAAHAGSAALAMILTGMGSDGLLGARRIRAAGGRILAESAASCVVYGMPRSVIEAGLADVVAPLDRMAERLVELILERAPAAPEPARPQ
ncbi:MAG: chemotaxis-specific protein-glutamate methyltransferase CheB [Steroidobacteraceae bacterium]